MLHLVGFLQPKYVNNIWAYKLSVVQPTSKLETGQWLVNSDLDNPITRETLKAVQEDLISNIPLVVNVVFFLLGDSPTFRNTQSVPSNTYEDGTHRVFRNVGP